MTVKGTNVIGSGATGAPVKSVSLGAGDSDATPGGASPIFPLDWPPEDATAFGYLHLDMIEPDNQAFSQTLSSSDTATNNVYLAFRDQGLTTNTVAVGASDIIAFGLELTGHTAATADINTGGVFMSLGALWASGAASFRTDLKVASGANRELVYQPAASYTTSFSDGNSQGDLGSFTHKVVIYFNGATGKIGWAYYNHFTDAWVDKGYDPAAGTFTSPIIPFVSIDNDSVPVPALDGATITGSFKTDTTWLADASSVLPAGSKAVDGTTI